LRAKEQEIRLTLQEHDDDDDDDDDKSGINYDLVPLPFSFLSGQAKILVPTGNLGEMSLFRQLSS
jgi:hypothetical protein